MSTLKPVIPLAALALLVASVPAANAASAPPSVCTYDLIESVGACVTRDSTGRTCVIVYVGPSTPVYRCANPDQILDIFSLCAELAVYDAGACVTFPEDHVCVDGHWGHYPVGECVQVGPIQASSVKAYCVITQRECVGYLACVYATAATPKVCVPDPCYTTACWTVDVLDCVVIVPEGGDMGEKLCWDLSADCKVWYERTTFLGTTRICLVGHDGSGGVSSTMGVECMDRYWVHDNGAFRIESRSTCQYDVCVYDADGVCQPVRLE